MTLRCVSFLGLLAVLALADYLILREQIKTHKFDAALINISGRQRLIFERSALLARYLVNTPDKIERANVREQLLEAIQLLGEYEDTLIKGNPKTHLGGNPPPLVVSIYFDRPFFLHARLENYTKELQVLALTRDENLSLNDIRLLSIRTIASGKTLEALDAVVDEYQKQSEAKIIKAQILQRWIFGSTLFVLLVVGFYLFRPMIRRVHEETGKMQELNAQLEKLALLDPLTELLNRRGLQKVLTLEIQRVLRTHSALYAILLDLDDFKQINDTLGYPVGDIVLKEISTRLKDALRNTDYVARIGGDEFMILLVQTRKAEGVRVSEKMRSVISETPVVLSSGKAVTVTASLGLVEVSSETPSIDELLAEVHPMLFESKRSGKNRVSHKPHNQEPEKASQRFEILSQFNASLHHGHNLYTVMQPIFRLSDLTAIGYEFLSRSSVEGFENPDDFFRICLGANILTSVDHQCFKNCIRAGAALPLTMHRHLNLFPSTIINIPISNLVESIPKESLNGTYCIEISEQQIIGDPSYLIEPVRELKQANILIGIDDVGFGRSCLESLILLEPNLIKIDKKCVKGIAQDANHARALRQLLKVAEALGAEVTAEGIESNEDLQVLRDLGVKYGQGYLLGKPARWVVPSHVVKDF